MSVDCILVDGKVVEYDERPEYTIKEVSDVDESEFTEYRDYLVEQLKLTCGILFEIEKRNNRGNMKLIIHIKPDADLDRIAGYIGELPRHADWDDVVDHIEKDDEE